MLGGHPEKVQLLDRLLGASDISVVLFPGGLGQVPRSLESRLGLAPEAWHPAWERYATALEANYSEYWHMVVTAHVGPDAPVPQPLEERVVAAAARRTAVDAPPGEWQTKVHTDVETLVSVGLALRQQDRDLRGFLVVGEPGLGKTLALRYLAVQVLRRAEAAPRLRVPIYLPLNQYRDQVRLADFIRDVWPDAAVGTLLRLLRTKIVSGTILLLLDGWNEVGSTDESPASVRARLAAAVADFQAQFDTLVLATTRPPAVPDPAVLPLRRVVLQPLGEPGIAAALALYAPAHARDLRRAIAADARLAILASNPYRLKLLAELYRRDGTLPRTAGALFAVRLQSVAARYPAAPAFESWQATLCTFADWLQRHELTQISSDALALPLDAGHIEYARTCGLFRADPLTLAFEHQQLQEYFAAVDLARQIATDGFDPVPLAAAVTSSFWDAYFLLLADLVPDTHHSALLDFVSAHDLFLAARCIGQQPERVAPAQRQQVARRLYQIWGSPSDRRRV